MATKVFTYDSVTGVRTGEDFPRRNALINGDARVNQRVTAFTLVKDVYGIAVDRFYGMATGTAVSAGTLTSSASGVTDPWYKWLVFSGVTITGTGIVYLRYRMEARDAARFKNQTCSFKCQTHQDTGGAINYTVYIRKADAADNFAAVTAISDSGAISVPNATTTSLPYLAIAMGECGNGIEIEIKVECGAVTTKSFYFAQLQLELGSVATPFEFRPYGQELALCQRYCQALRIDLRFTNGVGAGASWNFPTFLPVTMRATPTTTLVTDVARANVTSETATGQSATTIRYAIVATNADTDTYQVSDYLFTSEL